MLKTKTKLCVIILRLTAGYAKQTFEITETAVDPKTKLQARAIANDCHKFILDMSTNAGIVSDALKYVTQKRWLKEVSTRDRQKTILRGRYLPNKLKFLRLKI